MSIIFLEILNNFRRGCYLLQNLTMDKSWQAQQLNEKIKHDLHFFGQGMARDHFWAFKKFRPHTVCPKLFGTPKMYQNGPQMSNYCAQLPPHTGLDIHGWPQIQKSPYGYTHFIVFQNAIIQTIFEDVKKAYFKFNQITMRPAYNGEELFFEQNK